MKRYSPKVERILKRIAKMNDTTLEAICRELEALINDGWVNPDPIIHARWVMIGKGKKPTLEQLLLFSAHTVKEME